MLSKLTLLVFAILLCASLTLLQYFDTRQMSLLSYIDDDPSLQIGDEQFRKLPRRSGCGTALLGDIQLLPAAGGPHARLSQH